MSLSMGGATVIGDLLTIIITYNGERWIQKCLQSLKSSRMQSSIWVIDNDSSDTTVEIVKEEFPDVRVIESKKNLGFGAANNLGLKLGLDEGYEYYFLLNQDTRIDPDTLGGLHSSMINNPQFGIVSPVHLNGSGDSLDRNFEWYVREEMAPGLLKNLQAGLKDQILYEVPFVNAAAWLMSRSCLTKIGMFHPMFYHYGEDDNYVHRVRDAGFKVGVRADVTICHDRAYRNEHYEPDDFEKMLYKDLALYLLNPAREVSFWNFKKYVQKRIKLYRDKTRLNERRANLNGFKLALKVYLKSRRHYDLNFDIK